MRFSIVPLAVLGLFGILTSCAHLEPHQMDMTQAIRNAKTPSDHNSLARHYEESARDMQAKVDEHKKMLAEYEAHREYYGRLGLNMDSMCRALIHEYGQAAKENMDLANSHRKMAAEAK